jgi:hypothetical protein
MNESTAQTVTVEVLKGGFVITYPKLNDAGGVESLSREVCVSPRKLNLRLKEIIETLSLVGDTD